MASNTNGIRIAIDVRISDDRPVIPPLIADREEEHSPIAWAIQGAERWKTML